MAVIRKIEIQNFRCVKSLSWQPVAGTNCLIGPGDSGKSTILDAIDYCLGARRNLQLADTDFHCLEVSQPIKITVTLGKLDDALKSIESYGPYLRGFDAATGELAEEPEASLETVLALQMHVDAGLEPQWTLVSERAAAQGLTRNLSWQDRLKIAPTRLGAFSAHNLSWRRGSILNRLSEERPDASAALVAAARDVRAAFGDWAKDQLNETLKIVANAARELGISVGGNIKALLDSHSVSISGGTISLHDDEGVPLKELGLGSARLLIAGLQRKASASSPIALVDELEYGLEPHRIIRLVDALGAKETDPPLQVFITTHSPIAVRELSGNQLFVVRERDGQHSASLVGTGNDVQGTIRTHPEALLAPSILVCEGATEVGFMRGLDQHRVSAGKTAMAAHGVALVDGGGTNTFRRANAFLSLGYRTAVLRDSDAHLGATAEETFRKGGGAIFAWTAGRSIEDELFECLPDSGVDGLLAKAIGLREETLVKEHIRSASANSTSLDDIRRQIQVGPIPRETRRLLAAAAKSGAGWFKTVSAMERTARDVIGPTFANADGGFRAKVSAIFRWVRNV
jgi:putative ATP-dependent endonuclease of the OLD family